MNVPSSTPLAVSYRLHVAPSSNGTLVSLMHGLSHTRAHFARLIGELNDRGIDCAAVDIQSGDSFFRNWTALASYAEAAAEALYQIERDTRKKIAVTGAHSMGGRELEMLQRKHPELRRPSALLAPIPPKGALPGTGRALVRKPAGVAVMAMTANVLTVQSTPEDVRMLFFNDDTPDEIVVEAMRGLRHTSFRAYLELGLPLKDLPPPQHPTLLLTSDTDFLFHDSEYDGTREHYGDLLTQNIIPGGHDFFIEHAARTAEEIATFARAVKTAV